MDAFKALRLLVESPLRPFGNGSFETVTPDGDEITLQAEKPLATALYNLPLR